MQVFVFAISNSPSNKHTQSQQRLMNTISADTTSSQYSRWQLRPAQQVDAPVEPGPAKPSATVAVQSGEGPHSAVHWSWQGDLSRRTKTHPGSQALARAQLCSSRDGAEVQQIGRTWQTHVLEFSAEWLTFYPAVCQDAVNDHERDRCVDQHHCLGLGGRWRLLELV